MNELKKRKARRTRQQRRALGEREGKSKDNLQGSGQLYQDQWARSGCRKGKHSSFWVGLDWIGLCRLCLVWFGVVCWRDLELGKGKVGDE